MTSLTRAKQMTKLIALGGAALILALIVFNILIKFIGQLGQPSGPNATVVADMGYGHIETPKLPDIRVSAGAVELSLDLVNGSLPESSPTANVYKVATPSLTLSAQDRARTKASSLEFTNEPEKPDANTFNWTQGSRSLKVDLRTQTFDYRTAESALGLANRQQFSRFSSIGSQTAQFLQKNFLFTDIDFSRPSVRFVNPLGNYFLPQPESATIPTSYAEVSFLRTNLNGLPLYTSRGKLGPLTTVVVPPLKSAKDPTSSSAILLSQIVNLHNTYLPIDKTSFATYPILNAPTAYALLKSNVTTALTSVEPVNSSSMPSTLKTARVLFATLVYLEPDELNSKYVQPVWLFEGRGETNVGEAQWTAMVPAIDQGR